MCEMTTIITTASAVIAAATSAYTASTNRAAAKQQANIEAQEAYKMKTDAAYERQAGIEEARTKRLKSILNMEEQKSKIASNNILTSSQTALNVMDDIKLNGELDALNTLKNSEKISRDYLFSADKMFANSELTSFSSRRNNISGSTNTVNNLVSKVIGG